jgi:hypothetical protein
VFGDEDEEDDNDAFGADGSLFHNVFCSFFALAIFYCVSCVAFEVIEEDDNFSLQSTDFVDR